MENCVFTYLVVLVPYNMCHNRLNNIFEYQDILNLIRIPGNKCQANSYRLQDKIQASLHREDRLQKASVQMYLVEGRSFLEVLLKIRVRKLKSCNLLGLHVGTGKQGSVTHCTSSKTHSSLSVQWYL